ncbi:3-dehydroquinate synthase [bacterium]|nr:3-dehydroquinate synthase [candidate division CSSED10-310 bacterium]
MKSSSPSHRRITIEHRNGTYDIVLGTGLISQAGHHCPSDLRTVRGCIVTDHTVARLFLRSVTNRMNADGFHLLNPFVFSPGERSKSIPTLTRLYHHLGDIGLSRSDFIIALGGGVPGDLAGFAAATYMRGISYIQIPTTLLAQVDASIGGKTAVNLPHGKNLVGAFHAPRAVIADPGTLTSLPRRHMLSGLAEILKIALIANAAGYHDLAQYIMEHGGKIPVDILLDFIVLACMLKSQIVQEDETEQGIRAWLNFGHTFGHAIEQVHKYRTILHGEAVALGMVAALHYAARAAIGPIALRDHLITTLAAAGLPVSLPQVPVEALVHAMTHDKKAAGGIPRLVLLQAPGKPVIINSVDQNLVRDAFQFLADSPADHLLSKQ